MLLAGDIGGTKTDLAVFSPEGGPRTPLAQAEYRSAHYPSLQALVREFLAATSLPVTWACFDVAGPVIEGRAKVTNLPWELDEGALAKALNLRVVHLLNDLEAVARAVPELSLDDVVTLNVGERVAGGAIAVIAPGTGLGEAFLTWDGIRYRAFPSEGGHADFAPGTRLEAELLTHLLGRYEHVSVERVCSGPGLGAIYDYLRASGAAPEAPELAGRLAAAEERAPIISEAGLREPADPLSAAAIAMFAGILGGEAGSLALKVLATGGVYLAGGIPQHLLPALRREGFMQAFVRKGRLSDLMRRIPVHVVVRQAAIFGAAIRGLELGADPARPKARGAPVSGGPGATR
jgi:glucokinase